tara:strand:+ start:4133 stop:5422 length:1290 start_codon:yes stop_codon:yes gene_type:complete
MNIMTGKIFLNNKIYILNFFTIVIFFLGFLLSEDSSGSGKFDFINFLLLSQSAISNDIVGTIFDQNLSGYTPLHFIIYIPIYDFFGEQGLRVTNFIFSFLVIYIFYLTLQKRFINIEKKYLLSISFLPLLDPYFRSAAYWFQNDITALIFFSISLYFFNDISLKIKDQFSISKNEIFKKTSLVFIFSALAFYCKQNYIFFTIFVFFFNFIKIRTSFYYIYSCFLNVLLYLPFFIYIYFFKNLTPGAGSENLIIFSLQNSLIFFSFVSFYFFPLIIFQLNKKMVMLKKNLGLFITSIILFIIMLFFFDYNSILGGGVYYKISKILFDNYLIFYLTSFIGLAIFLFVVRIDLLNNLLIFIPLFLFINLVRIPFQEYFAIFFFYIFFIIMNKNMVSNIFINFKKKYLFLYSYFFLFLLGSILYNFYKLKVLI